MSAFYQAGELPVLKGHYLIFSLIDLSHRTSRSFSLLDKKLAQNMIYINIPVYLLRYPYDENILRLYSHLLQGRLPAPHKWLQRATIENDTLSLVYGNSFMVFKDNDDGRFEVNISGDGMKACLEFKSIKPVSLIGGSGRPDKLYYYSFPRNKVKGYISKGASIEYVTGEGWFDHQWGYTGGLLIETGWNWFGLQLDDGRELLLNEFRSVKTGETFSPMANLIEADGRLRFTRNIELRPLGYWQSPLTKSLYPLDWLIQIPEFKMKIHVSAIFAGQEMPVIGPLRAIWEGACSVEGGEALQSSESAPVSGKGFMELVGYSNYSCK
jgi:predicted secreted hydrolase